MYVKRTLFVLAFGFTCQLADAGREYYTAHNCSDKTVVMGTKGPQSLSWSVQDKISPGAQKRISYWLGTENYYILCDDANDYGQYSAAYSAEFSPPATVNDIYCNVNTGNDSGIRPFKISTSSSICN